MLPQDVYEILAKSEIVFSVGWLFCFEWPLTNISSFKGFKPEYNALDKEFDIVSKHWLGFFHVYVIIYYYLYSFTFKYVCGTWTCKISMHFNLFTRVIVFSRNCYESKFFEYCKLEIVDLYNYLIIYVVKKYKKVLIVFWF